MVFEQAARQGADFAEDAFGQRGRQDGALHGAQRVQRGGRDGRAAIGAAGRAQQRAVDDVHPRAAAAAQVGAALAAAVPTGREAQFPQQAQLEPRQEGRPRRANGELVERVRQQIEETGRRGPERHRPVQQPRGVGRRGAGAPIRPERRPRCQRGAFLQHVQVALLAGVEEDFAGVEQIHLPQERAALALAAFRQRRQLAVAARQPHDDPRGVAERIAPQREGVVLQDHRGAIPFQAAGSASSHAVSRRRMARRRAGVSSSAPAR